MENQKRPNILVFMTDQQRGDSVYPACRAITPNVTRLAREGIAFSSAYTVSPHCCPSRATFFSGLYPSQHGVWNNVEVGNTLSRGFFEGVRLFSEDLHDAGYRMSYSGKWHASSVEGPLDRGFELFRVDTSTVRGFDREAAGHYRQPEVGEWRQYEQYRPQTERGEGQILRRGYLTYTHYGEKENPKNDLEKIEDAVDLIVRRKEIERENGLCGDDRPWFQFIGPAGPHDPYEVPQEYLELYDVNDIELPNNFYDTMKDKPGMYRKIRERFEQLSVAEQKEAIRHYLAYCTYEDELLGRVLDALDQAGERENTLVIFTSDHGDYMGEHGLWCKGLPCFKGAYHIPFVCRWPAGIRNPGRVEDDFVTLADFAPTFLEVAGIPTDRRMAGKSLVPYLCGGQPEKIQTELYTQSNGNELYGIQRSVTTREWKYVYNGFDFDELYHLTEDPCEQVNVMERYRDSEILKDLSKKLWAFARENEDVCVNPYILVGLASYGPGVLYQE